MELDEYAKLECKILMSVTELSILDKFFRTVDRNVCRIQNDSAFIIKDALNSIVKAYREVRNENIKKYQDECENAFVTQTEHKKVKAKLERMINLYEEFFDTFKEIK